MSGRNISSLPGIASNITSITQCTPALCSLDPYAVLDYVPNAGSNFLFACIFAVLTLAQLWFWIRHRTHSFSFSMCVGLILEILGYLARVIMKHHMFESGPFLMQIICLTIAPVFFTAALYLTLGRVIMHYGVHNSRLSPKAYTLSFITSDFIALVLQSAGGAIADTAATPADRDTGVHIMVAGLAFQVVSLIVFMVLCSEFFWRVKKDRDSGRAERGETSLKMFLIAFATATLLILVRSCFRVAELAHGFDGKLANDQAIFMVLEGGVIILATFLLTVFRPGHYIGRHEWKNSGWAVKRDEKEDEVLAGEGSDSGGGTERKGAESRVVEA